MSAVAPQQIRAIVEAILLTSDTPVSPGRLLAALEGLEGLDGRHLREAIDALKTQYEEAGHACTIVEVAGGFQLATRPEYGPWVRRFHGRGQVRLSQAALETLAIVAFRQPITRVEVENIRGVNCDGVIRTLLELDLIRLVGRSEGIGKPMLFGTTKDFLVHFGLKGLADLPKPRELDELLAAGERKAQLREAAATGQEEEAAAGPAGPDDTDETQVEEPPDAAPIPPAPAESA